MTSGDARFKSDRGTPPDGLPDSARAPRLAEQTVVFGRYRILRELGRGGMGVVYLARDEELGIEVAIKLFPDLVFQDDESLAELKREVLRGIALTHPGIVRTLEFVRDEAMAGIVMEYIDGGTFALLKREQPGGCFDVEDLLPWLEQLCPILDFAHSRARIAHRDLKPRNLMFTSGGQLKVADFGISSTLCETVSRVSVQKHTSGTPAYMSPQQVMGARPSHLDDIYSLGATIYELLTGKPPFHRGQVVAQVKDSIAPSMEERRIELEVEDKNPIPAAWERTVAACLAKDPARRPQSAGTLLAMLKAVESMPTEIPTSGRIESFNSQINVAPVPRWRKPALAGAAAVLAFGLLAFVFWPKAKPAGGPPAARGGQSKVGVVPQPDGPAQPVRQKGETEPKEGPPNTMAPAAPAQPGPALAPGSPLSQATAADLAAARPGDLRTADLGAGLQITFCGIPAGKFLMGSPADEANRRPHETRHEVTLSQAFWLARTEVTQAQWRSLMGSNPSSFQGESLPVEQISWKSAAEFCAQLTDFGHKTRSLPGDWEFALPSEAQWEYACRAGTTGPYPDMRTPLDEMAWYLPNSASKTHPVGTRKPNPWGLHDMHGNVWEWCADRTGPYPSSSVTDPTGAASGDSNLIRGGSWCNSANGCRAASRSAYPADNPSLNVGFRPALVPLTPPGETVAATPPASPQALPPGLPDAVPGARGAGIPAKGGNGALQPQAADGAPTPSRGSGARPGEERKFDLVEGCSITMCWIPPGEFAMGSPSSENGRGLDEQPVKVTISHGFWLAKGECANSQWRAVKGIGGFQSQQSMPVTNVSWDDCHEFLGKLKVPMEGWRWGLPTEAQWEDACRAGKSGRYAGSGVLAPVGWYAENSFDEVHPIGKKMQNAWGLHDMHGNVAEWCSDWYGDYPTADVTDPAGPESGIRRVVRGGSWRNEATDCRSAKRGSLAPGIRSTDIGFRLALVRSK